MLDYGQETAFVAELDAAKAVVRAHHAGLDAARGAALVTRFRDDAAADYLWRGFHPFGELHGGEAVAARFWEPLKAAMTGLHRRDDIFFAGRNALGGEPGVWVVAMGHLVGLFDAPWLGIAPTGRMAFLRYCTFHRVADGRIAETAMYFDIPHLMRQAGCGPFGTQTAAHLVQPGPATHDGLLHAAQPSEEGVRTLDAIEAMICDLGQWGSGLPLEEELARSWHDDMVWWGPEGIGSTFTIERYARQHSGPFRAAFADRSPTNHVARLAEGHYGGFFGWPNFTARHRGGFMGMPGGETPGEFRVIDLYRRRGDKLAENWVFIDLLHFWKTQGVDYLGSGPV